MKIRIQELLTCILLCVILSGIFAIRCNREPEDAHSPKSVPDNKFEINIRGNPDKYVPEGDYTITLHGIQSGKFRPTFKRFMLVVQPSYVHNSYNIMGHREVGSLSLIDDTLSKFSNECPNAIIQTSSLTKSEIQVMWTAPPSDSGCVVFRATVVEDHDVWYMDDGPLSLVLCEDVREADIDQSDEVEKCCACDDAIYEMVFEGIWSKHTHPKDFPSNKWETAFSDMIGASHSLEYHFWEYGDFASKGLRLLAQHGDTDELENEIMNHGQNVRTIIKARGLRYPNVTGRTYSIFRVDTQNHLMSIVSRIDPSPDWVVGVARFNLCLKNCSWVQYKIINLYPWDVGSDSGISYNSPNSPTNPQQPISRITQSYPNDPDSPFYDATGEDMKPLAQLHLIRQQLYEKLCNSDDDDDFESEPEETPVECIVTNWSKWTECSESCGQGERFRQRSYLNKKKSRTMGCTEKLIQNGECYGNHPSCREELECEPMEWGPWSECSVTCGNGVETRNRRYRTRQEHKQCVGLPDSPELTEIRDCIGVEGETCDETSQESDDCPQTEWSSWSPCSTTCGKGKSIRMLLSVEDEDDAEPSDDCPKVDTIEEKDCFELPSCDINEELYRELCLSPLKEGACHGNNSRWYFDADTKTCENFIYRGCYGNKNNFLTQEDCENTCIKGSEEMLEEIEEDTTTLDGPVGGLWPASQIIDSKATYGIQDSTIPNYIFGTQTEPYTAVDGPVVDCVVGRWTRWSSCSVSCGTGYKMRNRKIVIHPRNGGIACPKVFKRKKCRKTCASDDKK